MLEKYFKNKEEFNKYLDKHGESSEGFEQNFTKFLNNLNLTKEPTNMTTNIEIAFDSEKIAKYYDFVKKYNETPIDKRESYLNLINIEERIATTNNTEYYLQIIPEWVHSIDSIDSSEPSDLEDKYREWYELDSDTKIKHLWQQELQVAIIEHDWENNTETSMTMSDFINELKNNLDNMLNDLDANEEGAE